jgi:hypothetical protein
MADLVALVAFPVAVMSFVWWCAAQLRTER